MYSTIFNYKSLLHSDLIIISKLFLYKTNLINTMLKARKRNTRVFILYHNVLIKCHSKTCIHFYIYFRNLWSSYGPHTSSLTKINYIFIYLLYKQSYYEFLSYIFRLQIIIHNLFHSLLLDLLVGL